MMGQRTLAVVFRCGLASYFLMLVAVHSIVRVNDQRSQPLVSVTVLMNKSGSVHLPNATPENIPSRLPLWIQEYFEWHTSTISRLNQDHSEWQSHKYLIVRCLNMDHKCGGAADRLKSIPLILLMASKHRRLLFIEWENPYPLSEFLLPVAMDWRLPSWLNASSSRKKAGDKLGLVFQRSPSIVSVKHLSRLESRCNDTLLDMRFQSSDHGKSIYNIEQADELSFDEVYHDLWSKMFRPSRGVEVQLNEARQSIRVLSQNHGGNYISLHIRSMYYKDKSNDISMVQNAIRCVAPLSNVIFVASDSATVVDSAKNIVAHEFPNHAFLTTMSKVRAPLHLDRGSDYLLHHQSNASVQSNHSVSDYYSIFVDLYLISEGRCVAYNVGGFGHWASLIAPIHTDSCQHFNHKQKLC